MRHCRSFYEMILVDNYSSLPSLCMLQKLARLLGRTFIPFSRMWEKEDIIHQNYIDYLSLSSFLFILMEMNIRINWWLTNEFYLSLSFRKKIEIEVRPFISTFVFFKKSFWSDTCIIRAGKPHGISAHAPGQQGRNYWLYWAISV